MAVINNKTKWYVYAKRADFNGIARRFGIDPVVARILRNRDIVTDEDIDLFLHGGIEDLYDEDLMPDMEKAVAAIYDAINKGERIRIVGDYDIDGVCATYILMDALSKVGAKVDHVIPDRINDGYGININIVRKAAQDGIDMILTCDNGIAALDEMEEAWKLGLKVVITDHHSVRKDGDGHDLLPKAMAIVDVKREDGLYPGTECCGAVTAWKLVRALYRSFGRAESEWLKYLDVAALATVGDIMKLTGENRIIVKEGLKFINGEHRELLSREHINPGLRTLIQELGLNDKKIDTYHIGFIIGPAINASGRLKTADTALKLLLSQDEEEMSMLSGHLKNLNESRKELTEQGVKEGLKKAESDYGEDKVLVIFLPQLHESLAGIVAGRIKEDTGKPCIVVTKAKKSLKASGRSIEGYDMFLKICEADRFLTRYGGHSMAAGLSFPAENLEPLREFLNEHAGLNDEDLIKKVMIDVPMPISYITLPLINEIDSLSPFGNGFERPLFADKNIRVVSKKIVGKNSNALRMVVSNGRETFLNAVMFGDAVQYAREITGHNIDILYEPMVNSFRGEDSIELRIRDYRLSKD